MSKISPIYSKLCNIFKQHTLDLIDSEIKELEESKENIEHIVEPCKDFAIYKNQVLNDQIKRLKDIREDINNN